jgi:hypothetical protein
MGSLAGGVMGVALIPKQGSHTRIGFEDDVATVST